MTPTYVYDLAGLDRHVASIRTALPTGVELLYAMKANLDPSVLGTLAPHVDGFVASSGGELRHLEKWLPDTCPAALAGPGKTDAELLAGLDAGARRFHVESAYDLSRLSMLAVEHGTTADVLLRVNLPTRATRATIMMDGGPSPFGMQPAEAVVCAALDLAAIRICGVHAHLASGLTALAAADVARLTVSWATGTLGVTEVNVGGGMAVDYVDPDLLFNWPLYGAELADLLAHHDGLTLRLEPGRAVTAYCGWYVTEVLDIIRAGDQSYVVVAGGAHHLRLPAGGKHSQPFEVYPRTSWDSPMVRPTAEGQVTIIGQPCTPKDVLARSLDIGRIAVGDRVAFAMAGAYAWNISQHAFLTQEPPGFVTGNPHQLFG